MPGRGRSNLPCERAGRSTLSAWRPEVILREVAVAKRPARACRVGAPGGCRDRTEQRRRPRAGSLLVFVDADDLWQPGKLARQTAALRHRPELDAVFSHAKHFVGNDPTTISIASQPAHERGTMLIRRPPTDGSGRSSPMAARRVHRLVQTSGRRRASELDAPRSRAASPSPRRQHGHPPPERADRIRAGPQGDVRPQAKRRLTPQASIGAGFRGYGRVGASIRQRRGRAHLRCQGVQYLDLGYVRAMIASSEVTGER